MTHLGMHVQRGLQSLFRMSVRLSVTTFLALQATKEQNSDMRRFVAATASFKKGNFRNNAVFKSYGVKTKRTS